MKRLYFDKLTVVSHNEKRGLTLPLNRKATILKGENDVGKSSLIKTLMKTFGTQPHKETDQWKMAAVQSLVDFEIEGERYGLLKSKSSYGLFNANDELIDAFTSVTSQLSPTLARLFTFHLALNSKSGSTQATPAFLFLPFYADQDRSWVAPLEGFELLTQFQNYRRDVIWFHAGIRPNEYYIAKARLMEAQRSQEQEKHNRDIVMHAIRRIDTLLGGNDFSLNIDVFRREVDSLVEQSKTLATQEANLKDKIVSLRNVQLAIEAQLAIVIRAAHELGKDFHFATSQLDDNVECPTCGAHYNNSIAERFAIAADEDECRRLIETLQAERSRMESEYGKAIEDATQVASSIKQIDDLLAARKGDVNLHDILQSEGKRQVKEALYGDVNKLNARIGELDQEKTEAERQMREASDTKRTRIIKVFHAERMGEFLDELAVKTTHEGQYSKIDCRINESGSDGPRALLAYQFALLHTINEFSTSTFCPIVIDSPRQQDQDEVNWGKMRNFIKTRQPERSQLILGLVNDGNTDFEGSVHSFNNKYQVLRAEGYGSAADRIRPMIDAMIAARS